MCDDAERKRALTLATSQRHIQAQKARGLARFHVWIPDTPGAREKIKKRAAALVKRFEQERKKHG